ncbi:hypothetical protein LTR56_026257 [Elasticomyces elasticus]|nr:hypothetical protein LTR56_026257 [Elasticomyces elasticus]KAK5729582.1 hypothetical protein LTS12_027328 [Elasticomyces elasticus]
MSHLKYSSYNGIGKRASDNMGYSQAVRGFSKQSRGLWSGYSYHASLELELDTHTND